MVKTWTYRSPYNEPIKLAPHQPSREKYPLFAWLRGTYILYVWAHQNSSQETYMENKYQYKGHQPNSNMSATRLLCTFEFQTYGVAKVSKFFHVDMETTNTSNFWHGWNPKHMMKNSIVCQEGIYKTKKNGVRKWNFEVTIVVQCIEDCFYISINNWWNTYSIP